MEAYSAPYKPEKPVMMMVPIEQWDALQKFEQRALDAEYLLDVYKGAYKDVGGLEMDDDFILSLRDLKEGAVLPEPEYEYEMFFKSKPTDFCKIDGWYPIATDRIRNPNKIDQYIKNGLLRKLTNENTNN